MKFHFTLAIAALAIGAVDAAKPGKCKKNDDCKFGTCVSVENDIPGIEGAAQCTPEPVCAGSHVGACPTFSSWSKSFRKIQSVCAFIEPENCVNAQNRTLDKDDTVDCFTKTVTFGNDSISKLGIYGCIDLALYKEREGGFFKNYTDTQLEACKGAEAGAPLCNGQGTCAAKDPHSSEYHCVCNLGYTNSDNCLKANSNACNNLGQCGAGGECKLDTGLCDCKDGFGGNQCSKCTTDAGCNENGVCNADTGVCNCTAPFTGDFCDSGLAGSDASAVITSSVTIALLVGTIAFLL